MSNSLWFSRIFTLQSSSWFCLFFWLFLWCTWKKINTIMRDFFITIGFEIFQNFKFSVSHCLNLLILKLQQTHSYIHYLNNFLKPIFSIVITGGKGYIFGKNLTKYFQVYITLTWGVGYTIRATVVFDVVSSSQ